MIKTATPKYSQAQADHMNAMRVKERMAEAVIGLIYDEVLRELQDDLKRIVMDNVALVGSTHPSFIYKGKFHTIADDSEPTTLHDLHPSLHERMDDYLAERHQIVNYEVFLIKSFLKSLFIASDRISDYKQILPEHLHRAFDWFSFNGKKGMRPEEIARMKQRVQPSLNIIKSRLLNNRLTGRGQTP